MTSDHSKKPIYEFCPKPWCKISLINQTNYNAQKHVDACTEDKNKTKFENSDTSFQNYLKKN